MPQPRVRRVSSPRQLGGRVTATLHVVPHTHWDREWYLTFQESRIRLVHLVDRLLEILATDPDYLHFTLDGQTIVVDDYLAIRPERRAEIERHVAAGRLLVGPWTVLPDEFLVSPEALVRNFARGSRAARARGARMPVGYVPDPFGHVGQLPQILRGFGLECAAFRRGLGDEPCELEWEAPDGTRVLVAYLRDGYDNAARLPVEPAAFTASVRARARSLAPFCATPVRLLMNGTDHHEPQAELPALLAKARGDGEDCALSTLPAYFADLRAALNARSATLPVVRGELRDPRRHHLLPGVLSSRVWIKQQNDACERLLEREVEPLVAWAELFCADQADRAVLTGHLEVPRVRGARALVSEAWRILLECHPHDSICGCSIDAVHEDMRPRFAAVEEIGRELRRQSMAALADTVDTSSLAQHGAREALVVFAPLGPGGVSLARATLELGAGLDPFELVDESGARVPYRELRREGRDLARLSLEPGEVGRLARGVSDGWVMGLAVQGVGVAGDADTLAVDLVLSERGAPDMDAVEAGLRALDAGLARPGVARVGVHVRLATRVEIETVVRNVAPNGYWSLGVRAASQAPAPARVDDGRGIESERFAVEVAADGTLRVEDRALGARFDGLLRLRDVADRGDSYNFCAVPGDASIERSEVRSVRRVRDDVGSALEIESVLRVPARLAPDRGARSAESVELPVRVRVSLAPELPRVDVEIEVDNRAEDHRLSVLFPVGAPATGALYDGHFEIVRRATAIAPGAADWSEQPVAEQPMRGFVAVAPDDAAHAGLLVAAHGLREASVTPDGTLAITLLRCFGWLSRDDFPARAGGAGPTLPTPGGQSFGPHRFRFALVPFRGDVTSAVAVADAFATGVHGAPTRLHAGVLPLSASLVECAPREFRLSALTQSESEGAILVRGVLAGRSPGEVRLRTLVPVAGVERVRLDETPIARLAVDAEGWLRVPARPNEVVTIRIALPGTATSVPTN